MTSVKESLQQLKQAEDNRNELINNVKQKASTMSQDAEQLAVKTYNEIVLTGKEKAEKIKAEARSLGQQEADKIIQQGENEATAIHHTEDEQIENTIKLIIQRIVENYGNR